MSHLILFVCTGNVCRSPMAAALFNWRAKRLEETDEWVAESAGTWANNSQPASGYSMTVMAQRGLDITGHRARTITDQDMEQSDIVIVMTRSHRDALAAEFPRHRHKIHLMSELRGRAYDIGDPYGGSLSEYNYCAQELEDLIESGYEVIKTWAPNQTPSNDSSIG